MIDLVVNQHNNYFHKKEIHEQYYSNNETSNEIFNAIEQSRIQAQGSRLFKGIKYNISQNQQQNSVSKLPNTINLPH